jgi:hypothetical protein
MKNNKKMVKSHINNHKHKKLTKNRKKIALRNNKKRMQSTIKEHG